MKELFQEELLDQHGASWARRIIAAIRAERDQARQPSLSEEEQAALRGLWADLQPSTRSILEGLLTRRYETLSLLNLVTLAIGEERTHALCNSELEQRNAYLEIKLAEYRQIIDLSDREKIEQQFMAVGQLLDYRALPKYQIGAGLDQWEDYRSWTDEYRLAEVIAYAREVLAQESSVKQSAAEKSKVCQAEKQLGEALAEVQALQKRIEGLEAERATWVAWKDAEVRGAGDLSAMRQYLQEHPEAAIPVKRNGVTLRIWALGPDGVACTEDHGILRLNDEELQQGRVWVCKKLGLPIIVTRLPIGSKRDSAGEDE